MTSRIGPAGIGRSRVPLGTYYAALIGLLYVPLAILLLFSFTRGGGLSFPLGPLSLDSYTSVLSSDGLVASAVTLRVGRGAGREPAGADRAHDRVAGLGMQVGRSARAIERASAEL